MVSFIQQTCCTCDRTLTRLDTGIPRWKPVPTDQINQETAVITWLLLSMRTYDRSGLRGLDEGQSAVISLFGDIDRAVSELVFLQDLLQLTQHAHPLALLVLAVGQHQDGTFVIGSRELGRCDLGKWKPIHEIRKQTPSGVYAWMSLLRTSPAVANLPDLTDHEWPIANKVSVHWWPSSGGQPLLVRRRISSSIRIRGKANVADAILNVGIVFIFFV